MNEDLPDFDEIDALNCSKGMYRLDRWPTLITAQIEFLRKVRLKYGPTATLHIVRPYDGYPGYVKVSV